jgi:hypothetical protein
MEICFLRRENHTWSFTWNITTILQCILFVFQVTNIFESQTWSTYYLTL